MITDRYAVKLTHSMQTDDPEYWALDEVLTKEEAKFMLSFGKTRVNYTAQDLRLMPLRMARRPVSQCTALFIKDSL